MKALSDEIKVVKNHLKHLTEYAIAWYQRLKDKYGKGRERKTEIRLFDRVEASKVALANVKLYMNREDGFIGTGLKKDEFIADCSDLDEIIVFREDGKCIITKVADKTFVGKGVIYAHVFKKGDERTIYNLIYKDGASGVSYIKRFAVMGVTRDKEYDLTKGSKGSKILYFTANPNGEAEIITVMLKPHTKLKKLQFDVDFADIAIKGRASQGNIVSKYPVKRILLKSKGVSTLSGLKIWYDDLLRRLNVDGRGKYLGEFDGDDKILQVHKEGWYELSSFELSNHFDADLLLIQKFDPEKPFAVVQFEGKAKNYFIKRFVFEPIAVGKKQTLISEETGSKFLYLTSNPAATLTVDVLKGKTQIPETLEILLAEFIDVKGIKANGNRLSQHEVKEIRISNQEEIEPGIEEERKEEEPVSAEDTADGGEDVTGETAAEISPADDEAAVAEEADVEEEIIAEEPVAAETEDEPAEEIIAPAPVEEVKPVVQDEAAAPVKAKPAKKAWGAPVKEKAEPVAEEAAPEEEKATPVDEVAVPVKPAKQKRSDDAKSKVTKENKPNKDIKLEITNPDDVEIDDKGQLGLF